LGDLKYKSSKEKINLRGSLKLREMKVAFGKEEEEMEEMAL
jgi:hypothetical protein